MTYHFKHDPTCAYLLRPGARCNCSRPPADPKPRGGVRCFTHETTDCKTPGCANAEGPVARAARLEAELTSVRAELAVLKQERDARCRHGVRIVWCSLCRPLPTEIK